MSMKHVMNVRLEEKDMEKLRRDALTTGRSISDHIRLLIRMPVEMSEGDGAVLLLSLADFRKVELQLQRAGISFNQSVHALNSLALCAREGVDISRDFAPTFNFVAENLEAFRCTLIEAMELLLEMHKRAWVLQSPRLSYGKSATEHYLSRIKESVMPQIENDQR